MADDEREEEEVGPKTREAGEQAAAMNRVGQVSSILLLFQFQKKNKLIRTFLMMNLCRMKTGGCSHQI